MSAPPNRASFAVKIEILAEEVEDALAEALGEGDLVQAAELWATSATLWSAAEQLRQTRS